MLYATIAAREAGVHDALVEGNALNHEDLCDIHEGQHEVDEGGQVKIRQDPSQAARDRSKTGREEGVRHDREQVAKDRPEGKGVEALPQGP